MPDLPITRRTALLSAASGLSTALAAGKRPNVLFFLPDQVRKCELGCYGGGENSATPNVDRFAQQAVTFHNCISTYPLCTPYRAMLQTGRLPANSGGVMNWINLPATGHAMGNAFNDAGYDTGYIGKWHLAAGRLAGTLDRNTPPPPRKESEFVPPGPARMGYRYWAAYNFHTDFMKAFYYRDTSERLYMPKFETDSETDMAIDYMRKQRAADKPFFLIVSPHPPHPEWRKDLTPARNLEATPGQLKWRPNVKGRRDQSSADPRCYIAMIKNMDENFGRLMHYLDESGLADDTIVVFTSDHGEMLASQGRYNKMVPYAEALDVPLVIRWPKRIHAGSYSQAIVTPVDFYPTLASLCSIPVLGEIDGRDFSAAVLGRGEGKRSDALIMNFVSHWDFPETNSLWPEWRGVRGHNFTYVKWLNGPEEFYDNQTDPYQLKNLFDGRHPPATMLAARARLTQLLAEAHDEFLPGNRYASWFNLERNLVRNALGPVG